jgi:hypothetical protein
MPAERQPSTQTDTPKLHFDRLFLAESGRSGDPNDLADRSLDFPIAGLHRLYAQTFKTAPAAPLG